MPNSILCSSINWQKMFHLGEFDEIVYWLLWLFNVPHFFLLWDLPSNEKYWLIGSCPAKITLAKSAQLRALGEAEAASPGWGEVLHWRDLSHHLLRLPDRLGPAGRHRYHLWSRTLQFSPHVWLNGENWVEQRPSLVFIS